MSAFYNEIDPYASAWIENLIKNGHVASGKVDSRSICDLKPEDVQGYTQAHFFAGIGVWQYALRLVGISDDQAVWSGSCPCQGFSVAGKQRGFKDERHLWPVWFQLIKACLPPIIFGEQVSSKEGLVWLDLVIDDLESVDYEVVCFDLPAAGLGAPHIRQRLYFGARRKDAGAIKRGNGSKALQSFYVPLEGTKNTQGSDRTRVEGDAKAIRNTSFVGNTYGGGSSRQGLFVRSQERGERNETDLSESARTSEVGIVDESDPRRRGSDWQSGVGRSMGGGRGCTDDTDAVANPSSDGILAEPDREFSREGHQNRARGDGRGGEGQESRFGVGSVSGVMGNASGEGLEGYGTRVLHITRNAGGGGGGGGEIKSSETGSVNAAFWHDAEWIYCRDEKYRAAKPGTFPVGSCHSPRHGTTQRRGAKKR